MPFALPKRALAALTTTVALVGGLLLVPVTAASAAEVQDASNTAARLTNGCCGVTWGQSFVPNRSGALTRIEVDSSVDGAVSLYSTAGGVPTGAPIASGARTGAAADGWSTVTFATPAVVTAGVQYAYTFYGSGSMYVSTGSAYPAGTLLNDQGTSWYNYGANYDMRFRTFVDAEPPTISGTPTEATRGSAYSFAFTIGGPASTSAVTAGALPAGLTMNSAGVITGAPAASGDSSFTVSTTGNGQTVTHQATLKVTGVPTAARDLAGTGVNGAVDVTWTAPADGGNSGTVGYDVTATPVGSSTPVYSESQTQRSVRISGLDNALDYTVTVTPRNTKGAGASTSVVLSPPAAPAAPTGLTVVEDDEQVTVSWAAPTTDGGSPIVRYEASVDGGAFAPATSPLTITGPNGTTIDVEIRAINRSRTGAAAATDGTPRTVPDAPALVDVTPGDGRVELSWTAPEWDGGAQITGYLVEHREARDGLWSSTEPTPGTERTAPVSGLENGVEYEFRVIALNEAGESQASETLTEIPFRAPDAPALGFTGQGDGVISLGWNAPAFDGGRALEGYVLEFRAAGDEDWATYTDGLDVESNSIDVVELTPGTDYAFRLRAVNEAGPGAASESVTARFAVAAGAPTGLTSTLEDGAVVLNWAAPESDGGSEITRYDVIWSYEGAQMSMETSVLGTTARITGLPAGVEVSFWVHAVTIVGAGADATTTAVPFDFTPIAVDADGERVRTVHPGDVVTLTDRNLPVGATVTAELHSTPVELGETVIGADGELSLEVRIPKGTELGAHEIVLSLTTTDGATATAALPIRVVTAATGTGNPDVDAAVEDILAVTGTDGTPIGAAALLLLTLGVAMIRRSRRGGMSVPRS